LVGAVDPLRHDALGAKPTPVGEDSRTILADVFVEQDARLSIAQQACQRGLAFEERARAQILAIRTGCAGMTKPAARALNFIAPRR
jgi:hypothetical protein